jgi:hypothetical protein
VTGLAALKILGVTAGALLAGRSKREEPSNQVDYNKQCLGKYYWYSIDVIAYKDNHIYGILSLIS